MDSNINTPEVTEVEAAVTSAVNNISPMQEEMGVNRVQQPKGIEIGGYVNTTTTELTPDPEQLTAKIAALEHEVAELKIAKIALDAQNEMLVNLLNMAETPELEEVLKVILQQAVDISSQLTGAESIFLVLLNHTGAAKDSILKHSDLTTPQQHSLISKCLSPEYISLFVHHPQALTISDTFNDEHWQALANQLEAVRSVLSVPILKNQALAGILTLTHRQRGYFSAESAKLMQVVAQQIALAIEYARCYGELETYSHAVRMELEKGREIQQDFLPNPLLHVSGWEIAAFFKPARRLAGDFYDTFLLPNGSFGIIIGDVCDKGVGAALFMGLFRSLLRLFSGQHSWRPSNTLNQNTTLVGEPVSTNPKDLDALEAVMLTNNYIAQNHSQLGMFATLFFGVLNPETGVLSYINAGHELPIILRASGAKERLKTTGPVVGPLPKSTYKVLQVQLEPGDILIGYSDGVTDARSAEGKFFTEKRLLAVLEEPVPTATALLDRIKDNLLSHVADAEPFDDITIVAVQQIPALLVDKSET